MSDYVNPLHLFGICFPHKWGGWYVMRNGNWMPASRCDGGRMVRWCAHCNKRDEQ